MSGIVEKVKETLHIGKHHDHPEHREGYVEGPGGTTAVGFGGSNTKGSRVNTPESHPIGSKTGDDCATGQCHKTYEQQGKHVPWEDAQEKTKLASQEAHRAEVAACKAHKHLSSVAESQQEAEAARTRLAELESELDNLRTRGVDLSAKQSEIEVAKRAAEEAAVRARQARADQEAAEREAAAKERHAAEMRRGLDDKHRGVSALEEELARLNNVKADAQKQHDDYAVQLHELESSHSNKQSEMDRLNKEVEDHARAVAEAEAALAAVRDRHGKAHSRLASLRNEHEHHLRMREGIYSHGNAARTRLDDIKKREAELQELLARRRSGLSEHEGAVRTAAQEAEAERARAADAGGNIDPLARDAQEKRALVNEAEREAAEAAQRRRAEEQCARAIEGKLEGHRQTTQTAVHETRSRVEDYNRYKEEAEAANMRKEGLWDEAKHLGSVGDKNADRKVADMEKRLQNEGLDIGGKAATHTTAQRTTVVKEE